MGFLQWLEASAFADWIQTSFVGYPVVITMHSIGMAIMVGLALVLNLRLVGMFGRIPYAALGKLLGVAWIGFVINFLSGAALFTAQATVFATQASFIIKILSVFAGASLAAYMQPTLNRDAAGWGTGAVPGNIRGLAIASLIFWTLAIVAGRMTAYL